MRKHLTGLALILVLAMVLGVSAYASGEASGEASLSMDASAEAAGTLYEISESGLTASDLSGVTRRGGEVTDSGASGLFMTINDFSTNGFKVTGGEYTIRDSVITKQVTGPVDANAAGGYIAGVTNGRLTIDNCLFINAGKGGRGGNYTVDCERTGEMVVSDSIIIQTGFAGDPAGYTADIADPPSNLGLLISGYARANMSVGQSKTWYYGSQVITEGWAAMSTDSAQSGFTFYSYDSTGQALHGGYGTYADTSCVDWFYASRLISPEVGAIISNNGEIHMAHGDAATADALAYLPEDYQKTSAYNDGRSSIQAGRNDVQMHSPDMGGGGAAGDFHAVLDLADTDLVTSAELDAEATLIDWSSDYGPAVGAYIDLVKGANLLVKSTGAYIDLANVSAESYTGTLLMTALNSDSMSRYAKATDDMAGKGVELTITDSDIAGDVKAYDYQRNSSVSLVGSTWSGAYVTIDKAGWDSMWSDAVKADPYCYWILDPAQYHDGTGITASVTVDARSTWNVTGVSNIDALGVYPGGQVNGTVTVDGQPVDVSAGGYWTGDIVVTPAGAASASSAEPAAEAPASGSSDPAASAEPAPAAAGPAALAGGASAFGGDGKGDTPPDGFGGGSLGAPLD